MAIDFNSDLAVAISVGIITIGNEFDHAADDVAAHGQAGILLEGPTSVLDSVLAHFVS
jgi:hypothetical protein